VCTCSCTPREPGTIVKLSRAHALLLQFVGKASSIVFFCSQWISCCNLLEKQAPLCSSAHNGFLVAICWKSKLHCVPLLTMDFLLQFVGKTHSMVFSGSQWISCWKSKATLCSSAHNRFLFAICWRARAPFVFFSQQWLVLQFVEKGWLLLHLLEKKLRGLSHSTGDSIDSK
jgi:hypothetical protein